MDQFTVFDREQDYKEQIKDMVKKLKSACIMQGIPFYLTFAVKNNEDETKYISDGNLVGDHKFILRDDRLSKHLSIDCGFETVPYNYLSETLQQAESEELDLIEDPKEYEDEDVLEEHPTTEKAKSSVTHQNMMFDMMNVTNPQT